MTLLKPGTTSHSAAVEIAGPNRFNGIAVQLWDCHGGDDQHWNAP
ncbi:hypothetical protein AB0A63_33355 [Lentzea sp. NPDC042327]